MSRRTLFALLLTLSLAPLIVGCGESTTTPATAPPGEPFLSAQGLQGPDPQNLVGTYEGRFKVFYPQPLGGHSTCAGPGELEFEGVVRSRIRGTFNFGPDTTQPFPGYPYSACPWDYYTGHAFGSFSADSSAWTFTLDLWLRADIRKGELWDSVVVEVESRADSVSFSSHEPWILLGPRTIRFSGSRSNSGA